METSDLSHPEEKIKHHCMKKIFTTAAVLLFFSFCFKGQTLKLKRDTILQINTPVLQAYRFVKTPVYSALRPAPVRMPNGYVRADDKSAPMPVHKVEITPGRAFPVF